MEPITQRQLGRTDIWVSPIGLGCWPIAGMTSLHVNDADSEATLRAAVEQGVNFLDTAYCYGAEGESERLIGRVLGERREQIVIASKGGIHWQPDGQRVMDGRPQTLRKQCEASLRRLDMAHLDLLYLHAPDPQVPISESAGELRRLMDEGKTRSVGASNCNLEQLQQFQTVCPISAVQSPFNMLQRQIETEILPWCREHGASAVIYWPLMKGLLAGRLPRDFVFEAGDGRAKYPMFQGEEWEKNQDFLDDLRAIAEGCGRTVAQLVVSWTIHQPDIGVALCGAKRAHQITETAAAMTFPLDDEQSQAIAKALERRGAPIVKGAV